MPKCWVRMPYFLQESRDSNRLLCHTDPHRMAYFGSIFFASKGGWGVGVVRIVFNIALLQDCLSGRLKHAPHRGHHFMLLSPPPFSLRRIGPFPVPENTPFVWEVLLFLQDLLYESMGGRNYFHSPLESGHSCAARHADAVA